MPDRKKRPSRKTSAPSESSARPSKKIGAPEKPPSPPASAKPSTAKRRPATVKSPAPVKPPVEAPQPIAATKKGRPSDSLSILMVASEAHPYAKTGGLAEVVAALPDALGRLGHRVTLVLPRYRGIDTAGSRSESTTLPFPGRSQQVTFHTRQERPGVTVVFVDAPELFDRAGGLYNADGVDYPDNAWRFAVFCRAALEYPRLRRERPAIIHAHDWQSGLVPVYQKMHFSPDPFVGGVPAIFTIHNLAFQGIFPASMLSSIGFGLELMDVQALEYWGQISYLKGGINFSERLTTVSPTYAQEILRPEFGFGFDGILRRRQNDLVGILNGIDVDRWNPERDEFIGVSYGAHNLSAKAEAKRLLLETVGLPASRSAAPVIGVLSRLTDQKGFDLVAEAADELMAFDATWVMLGSGDRRYEELWRALAARFPERVSATIGFDERLAHRIEAGADMFLMPSRFEPCGLNQMYSLRYATPPIVRATGGLDDTVKDAAEPAGNGFKFTDYSQPALVGAVRRALELFRKPNEWRKIQLNGMNLDFSWDASAREYVKVYERAAEAANAASRGV